MTIRSTNLTVAIQTAVDPQPVSLKGSLVSQIGQSGDSASLYPQTLAPKDVFANVKAALNVNANIQRQGAIGPPYRLAGTPVYLGGGLADALKGLSHGVHTDLEKSDEAGGSGDGGGGESGGVCGGEAGGGDGGSSEVGGGGDGEVTGNSDGAPYSGSGVTPPSSSDGKSPVAPAATEPSAEQPLRSTGEVTGNSDGAPYSEIGVDGPNSSSADEQDPALTELLLDGVPAGPVVEGLVDALLHVIGEVVTDRPSDVYTDGILTGVAGTVSSPPVFLVPKSLFEPFRPHRGDLY